MLLDCPLCGKSVNPADFKATPVTRAAFECPECRGLIRYLQPHAAFRRSLALIASALLLVVLGVRHWVWLLVGSVLLWPLAQLVVNAYLVGRMPLLLAPWKPVASRPFPTFRFEKREDGPLEIFSRKRK
jgi:hypothetical protein